jgi:hypothetical protein
MRKEICLVTLLFVCVQGFSQVSINAMDARKHMGEVVTLCGKIFSAKYLQAATNQPTLLNLGGNYPNQLVTVAIFEIDRKNFPFQPEQYYPNLEVCVTGKLIEYKGTPEIIVQSPEQIKLQVSNAATTKEVPKKVTEPVKPKDSGTPAKTPGEAGEFEVTLTADVNLRSGPGKDYAIVAMLKAGSVVSVIRSNNGWSYVVVKKGAPSQVNGYIKNNVLQ